jgi:hypothetical protein
LAHPLFKKVWLIQLLTEDAPTDVFVILIYSGTTVTMFCTFRDQNDSLLRKRFSAFTIGTQIVKCWIGIISHSIKVLEVVVQSILYVHNIYQYFTNKRAKGYSVQKIFTLSTWGKGGNCVDELGMPAMFPWKLAFGNGWEELIPGTNPPIPSPMRDWRI